MAEKTDPSGSKKITLKTSDGHLFDVDEAVAMEFATVKSYFDGDDVSRDTPMPLPNVSNFVRHEDKNDIKELILAANYLNIKDLLDFLNQTVADLIANKSVEFVREFFNIENDFTPEEEKEIRKEYAWAFEGVEDVEE
ncbi:hypothetical protein L1049_023394 [Liquidambar formosana]|uniref:SKP1-like protein n=1 Tax=Liquidambar formosana TaxID=63359 RepID=A0AAP0RZY5_LIQFO